MIPAVSAPSTSEYRHVAGRFATGVTVLTLAAPTGEPGEDGPHGSTVSSFTSVSLAPLLVSACLTEGSSSLRRLTTGRRFAVNILAASQRRLAEHFADPGRPRGAAQFRGWPWLPGPYSDAPLLGGALGWLECRVVQRLPAGDHVIVLAEVHAATCGAGPPLLHFNGAFVAGADAPPCPGHC